MAFANQIGLQSSDGYIALSVGATGLPFTFTTSYQEMSGLGTSFVLSSPAQNFAMTTDGRLKYIGVKPDTFMFEALFQLLSAGVITTAIRLYKNGSPLAGSESYQGGQSGTQIIPFPVEMVTNDYVSLWVKRSSSTTPSIAQIILSATSANGS